MKVHFNFKNLQFRCHIAKNTWNQLFGFPNLLILISRKKLLAIYLGFALSYKYHFIHFIYHFLGLFPSFEVCHHSKNLIFTSQLGVCTLQLYPLFQLGKKNRLGPFSKNSLLAVVTAPKRRKDPPWIIFLCVASWLSDFASGLILHGISKNAQKTMMT